MIWVHANLTLAVLDILLPVPLASCPDTLDRRDREREMFYLMTHSTHFIYGYMTSDIWLRTILIVRKETRCHHTGYSYRLTARVLLYAPSHRQDNTYHSLCYTSRGALAGTRNSSMGDFKGFQQWNLCLVVSMPQTSLDMSILTVPRPPHPLAVLFPPTLSDIYGV